MNQFKIGTLNKISENGLQYFDRSKYQVSDNIENQDAFIVRSASLHDMQFGDNLKSIARAGAGVNNVPIEKCSKAGIVVFNTPGANANAVKELVIAGLLLSSRKIHQGVNWTQAQKGKGDEVSALVEKNKSNFGGPEISGKTLGVIGLGAIGMLVANAAEALGMRVVGFDPYISIESAWQLSKNVEKAQSLDQLLSESDYISLHIPLLEETKGFIDAGKMNKMKKGASILNFARGGLVNKTDLLAALEADKLRCFVTDFPQDILLGNEKIIAIPHLGASTPESEENCAVMAVNQTKEYLENGNIKNSINFPMAEMPRNGGSRIIIGNKNVPGMVGKITSVLAEQSINISDMLNKHKGDIAYNIIDVDGEVTEAQIAKIKQIDEIILVRLLQ
ncbi:MAG: phosphoglycerate dehydrogenase [Cyclobacteriaceae bacterium]|jgi:D-3-phosphoglycerate dehydrogenase / 2-oxoglutarate reductase|nr:phosphoglycerate dehydrogenase [Cyclobacteriaceae bacterium]